MSQVINTNVLSLNAQRNLNNSQGALAQSLERLSSGLRINSAKDDAAGLAISERFTTQIRGLNQAVRNANDGISFSQTAEGALGTVGDALQRVRELAVQSANDSNSASDRQALNNEVQQLLAEVNRVARSTEFNGQNILDGSLEDLVFQVGANSGQSISVDGVDARSNQLGARVAEGTSFTQDSLDSLITANDLVVNGRSIDLGEDGAGLEEGATASQLVAAINAQQGRTSIQAFTGDSVSSGDLTVAAGTENDEYSFTLNDVTITYAAGADADATAANLRQAINEVSTQTGVEAGGDNATLTLSNNTGETISVGQADGGADVSDLFSGQDVDAEGQDFYAGIVLASEIQDDDFSIAGTFDGVDGNDAFDVTQENRTAAGVNVLTRESSTEALRTLDFALQQVSGIRAELGAVQVRFENTISNLEISSENLSAARSRIQDADFASETAELTRAQVLQQAGTSVLSQANAVPQNVLALLQ
ncbi:flagellin [Thioalkalivibrio sp. ALM2T]|uniref:flagellin N-terminal helical domain-containing protein n=1 Tax=Thioalkalivibrio sp. ALM2T TaxID=1158184 RepID=UPI00036984F4|nr:flagellin [Thioalkalivibrio sp. ALM2T]